MKALIAAAGTAGHINPAISIANIIMKNEPDSKIVFLGTERGLENDLVPRAGYELKKIDAYGFSKKISFDNLKKSLKTVKGFLKTNNFVKEFKPDIIIGTGGYICGAAVIAGASQNIPVLLHESNAFPGKAVKMASKKANTILVSFEDAKSRLPNCKNVVFTGTPVKVKKINYSDEEKNKIIDSLGLVKNKPIVLIFGGSQGAQKINEAIIPIIKGEMNQNYQIVWATGPKQFDIIKENLSNDNIDIDNIQNCKVIPYIYNMEEVENIADLVVSRSGAMTITEISNLGKPSILIPLPNVSNDHQMFNAKVLENVHAAIIIENNNLTSDLLNKSIEDIVLNPETKDTMGQNAYKISTKDVEEKIYNEIKKLV